MEPGLEISVRQKDPASVVVTVVGEVDLASAPGLYSPALTALRGYRLRRLIFDFTAVDFLDCAGISVLLTIAHTAEAYGAGAELVNCQPLVLRVLDLTGALAMFGR